jgi:UDP-N-acetylmuramate dehydrogenase
MGLGGEARYFVACATVQELEEALAFAKEKRLPVFMLGGGSNTVFADEGFAGLVIRPLLTGIAFSSDGLVTVQAGEVWDDFVEACVERNLAGIECLSGIPGLVGAVPVQNVGAYGQRVSDVIERVAVLNRETLAVAEMSNAECAFSYRHSRFKGRDAGRYIILSVTFQLSPGGAPTLVYPQLQQAAGENPTLARTRQAVIAVRRTKSMVVDPADPHSRSCGSFFTNVVLTTAELAELEQRYRAQGGEDVIPSFPEGDNLKIPAAWLVEQAGFEKGTRRDGVGVSPNHALALVNYGGTARELLALAEEIQRGVEATFGITLACEPVVVNPSGI